MQIDFKLCFGFISVYSILSSPLKSAVQLINLISLISFMKKNTHTLQSILVLEVTFYSVK